MSTCSSLGSNKCVNRYYGALGKIFIDFYKTGSV